MIVHMVCFKYKPEVDAATRTEHVSRLRPLWDIDGILDLKVGEDILHLGRSFDSGLVVLFRDRSALDGYATHPRHEPVAKWGASLCERVVSVDFEV
jgi:hypothetical protein